MRGFPLLRSILILFGLAVSAVVLAKITRRANPPEPEKTVKFVDVHAAGPSVPYRLSLSAQPQEVLINSAACPAKILSEGSIVISPDQPFVALKIIWKSATLEGEQRFAKLTLDPPGKPTITHVFDAAGDIDDVLELP